MSAHALVKTKLLEINQPKFATELLIYRTGCNYTREKMAEILGISDHTVNRLECGGSKPSAEVLMNFCNISGNDIHSFFN